MLLYGMMMSRSLSTLSCVPRRRPAAAAAARRRSSSFALLGSWYSRKLDTHPILTKSISSAFVMGAGDALSQWIEILRKQQGNEQYSLRCTLNFGFIGLVWVGPVIHTWFSTLIRWFPGTSVGAVAKRVIVDQFLFIPTFFLPSFLSSLWILEGATKSPTHLLSKLQDSLPSTVVANWSLWIPCQIVNFRYVPGKYQVLFSNFVGFIWNVYLSYATHADDDDGHGDSGHSIIQQQDDMPRE